MYVLPEIAVDEVGIQIEENLVEGISEDGDYKKKKKRWSELNRSSLSQFPFFVVGPIGMGIGNRE